MNSDTQQWYVRRGSRVQGPYPARQISRYLLLGRIRQSDRVSTDGECWCAIADFPELIPPDMNDLKTEAGWQRYLAARQIVDERGTQSDGTQLPSINSITGQTSERRAAPDAQSLKEFRKHWQQAEIDRAGGRARRQRSSTRLPAYLVGTMFVGLLGMLWLLSKG
jgi:hypothetical protein